jgi:hypothetical protein
MLKLNRCGLRQQVIGFSISLILIVPIVLIMVMSNIAPNSSRTAFAQMLASSPTAVGNVNSSANVTPGTLSASNGSPSSISLTLNGSDRTATYTLPITVNDQTGSGNGWGLTITSTTFSFSGSNALSTPVTRALSTGATKVTGVAAVCAGLGTCTDASNSVSYSNLTVPAASTAPTAVQFFNAAVDTGLGNFTITPTFQVSFPANVFAGTYSSTLTISITSGP